MSKELTLFIGGILDGKRIVLNANTCQYTLPFQPGKLVERIIEDLSNVVSVSDEKHCWNRISFMTSGCRISVMVYQGITSEEVVRLLITKYPEKEVT